MRESIRESILSTVNDLYLSGIVDETTQREMESLCLSEIKKYSPHKIVALRKKLKLTQMAFARFLNLSPSTIKKWESGMNQPSGASVKLLDLVARNGLAGIR
ncbi:DNA-binding protein [Beggiatoa sp. PS]|nr:DNA-binding protein [Beggiatoa sp. PS]